MKTFWKLTLGFLGGVILTAPLIAVAFPDQFAGKIVLIVVMIGFVTIAVGLFCTKE